jgi:hypothetical protein
MPDDLASPDVHPLLGEVFDLADAVVERITDGQVQARLHLFLRTQAVREGQPPQIMPISEAIPRVRAEQPDSAAADVLITLLEAGLIEAATDPGTGLLRFRQTPRGRRVARELALEPLPLATSSRGIPQALPATWDDA